MSPSPSGVVFAGLLPGTGYGNATRDYLALLHAMGVPVQWIPLQLGSLAWGPRYWAAPPCAPLPSAAANAALADKRVEPRVALFHTPREFWVKLCASHPAPRLLACTTFEQTVLPGKTVAMLNGFDGVIVPSQFNLDSFRASGVSTPIWVVPHVVEPAVAGGARPGREVTRARYGIGPDTFVVYVIGPWQTRKAIPSCIEAFLRAFGPGEDVLLVVKTSGRDYVAGVPASQSLALLLGRRHRVPRVRLISKDLPDVELTALLHGCDCSLSLSRGEGFGLTIAEAIAEGIPAVVTGWGAPREFLGAGYPLFVDYRMADVASEPSDGWAETTGEWAMADIEHAALLLRWVRDHRDAANDAVAAARRQLANSCARSVAGPRLLEALGLAGSASLIRPVA